MLHRAIVRVSGSAHQLMNCNGPVVPRRPTAPSCTGPAGGEERVLTAMQRPPATAADIAPGADRRRRHPRFRTLGHVGRLDAFGDCGLCRVQDLSDGGLMIETRIPLSCGDPVRISFDCTNAVQGRVVWRVGNRAGIRFLRPLESFVLIRKIAGDRWSESVRPPRLPVSCAAHVTTGSASFPAVVTNVSQQGMTICHPGDLRAGTFVDVAMPSGIRAHGTVRWSAGILAGIELCGRLTVEQLASVRQLRA